MTPDLLNQKLECQLLRLCRTIAQIVIFLCLFIVELKACTRSGQTNGQIAIARPHNNSPSLTLVSDRQ